MKKNNITLILILFGIIATAQVRMTNGGAAISSVNSSAFIDASSQSTNNSTVGVGKGLVFPRVNLATFSFVGTAGLPSNFPSRFDGMIVYNTSIGGVAGAGATEGTLTEGYWYYYNKSNTITGGTWKKLQSESNVGSTSIVLNGSSIERAALTGDVTAAVNSNTTTIANNAVTSAKILDGTIASSDIANAAVTTSKIASGGNNKVLVTDSSGNVSWVDGGTFNTTFGAISDLSSIEGTGTASDPFKVKDSGIVSTKISNGAVTTSKIASGGNNKILVTDATGNVSWVDGSIFNTTFGAISDLSTIEGTGTASSPFKVKDSGIVSTKIADAAVTTSKIAPGGADKVLITDSSGVVSWVDGSAFNTSFGAITDMNTIDGVGSVSDPFKVKDLGIISTKIADAAVTTSKIASGGNNKILVTNSTGAVSWVDGTAFNSTFGAISDLSTIEGTGTSSNPFKVKDLGINTSKIANNAVTVAKLPAGATATTFLRGDGTWVTPAGNTYTAGSGLSLTGTSFSANDASSTAKGIVQLAGDLSGSATSPTIANNAITSAKIADGTIVAADLNNMSATAGQVLTFNGTNWAPSSSSLTVTNPTVDNYTVLPTDTVIYRNITSNSTITFPSNLPAGKVFYVVNLSLTSDWLISPTPLNTTNTYIAAGSSVTIVSLGGGQILVVSGY